jgi:hypothetical protein
MRVSLPWLAVRRVRRHTQRDPPSHHHHTHVHTLSSNALLRNQLHPGCQTRCSFLITLSCGMCTHCCEPCSLHAVANRDVTASVGTCVTATHCLHHREGCNHLSSHPSLPTVCCAHSCQRGEKTEPREQFSHDRQVGGRDGGTQQDLQGPTTCSNAQQRIAPQCTTRDHRLRLCRLTQSIHVGRVLAE